MKNVLPQLTLSQVFYALSNIKRTARGPDLIPYRIWKDHAEIFAPVILEIWNLSLGSQTWPKAWKKANINPLPKIDIPVNCADFRGINITPVIARVFERTVYQNFNNDYLESYLSPTQFAYRSGGSCINALIKMQHNFLKALDNRSNTAVRLFSMDFSKAFDNFKHNLLVEKLKKSPLNRYLVNWYISFLGERMQRVVCNHVVCEWKDVNKGTTQGSVSGPYLFNVLNDLEITGDNIDLNKYADDSTLQITVSKDCTDNTQNALRLFMDWITLNQMKCNTSKCKELVLKKKGQQYSFNEIYDISQHDTLTTGILGVTFHSDCKFTKHVKTKLYEANRCLYVIRSLRKEGYGQKDIDHLFKAIVLPKITYGLPVFGASTSDLNAVQCFLKRCHKRRYVSELIDIHDLLEKADRTLFEKISNDENHPLYTLLPKRHCTTHQLRSLNIVLPRVKTERFKNCFSNRLAFRYNLAI